MAQAPRSAVRFLYRFAFPALAIFLLAGAFPPAARAQSRRSFPRNDFQGWVDFEDAHAVRENFRLTFNGGLRWSDDASHLIYRRVGGGFDYIYGKYLTVSPFYNFYSRDTTPVREADENRIAAAVTVKIPLGRWTLSDRNQFENRFQTQYSFRYRNRLELQHPFRLVHTKLRGFVWDEVFYDSSVRAWSRNRAAIGAGKALTRHLSVDLYYLRQNDSHSPPGDLNVLGMTVRTSF
jgi:Protein of unknown function (DUF2490)